jgi:beta-lactamase class A
MCLSLFQYREETVVECPSMRLVLHLRLWLIPALVVACCVCFRAQSSQESVPKESPARAEIEKLIKQSGADVSVAFGSLDGSQELFILADQPFDDRDALRIPVMIELYAQADEGMLSLTDNAPPIGPNGTTRGPTVTLHDLCEDMIVNSSDPATNRLIALLGVENIRQRINSLGASGMSIGAPFPSSPANHTTVRALFVLLFGLATERIVSADATKKMVDILSRSPIHASPTFPSGPVPPKAMDSGTVHDAIIIFGARSFVFVCQIRGMADSTSAATLLAKITKILSNAV